MQAFSDSKIPCTTSSESFKSGYSHAHRVWLLQKQSSYSKDKCIPVSAIQRRHGFRSAVRRDLEVPRCNLARYGQRSFNVSRPSLWNSLPLTVRDSSLTLTQFCTRLKTFLFTRAYGSASVTASAVRIAVRTLIFLLTFLLTYLQVTSYLA